jgi:CubicO group peptidase (beta-lactamase class C family)
VDLENKLKNYCEQAVNQELFSGCVIGISDQAKGEKFLVAGADDYEKDATPLHQNSVFDIASVTKSIPTALLALNLILQKKLDPSDPVIKYFPSLMTSHRDEVRISHLLTHTLDFSFSMASLKNLYHQEIFNQILRHQFQFAPGQRYLYCNATSIVLGLLLHHCMGDDLEELARQYLFDPLGMHHTTYHPLEYHDLFEIVPTEEDAWRNRVVRGEVHDESAYALRAWGPVGSAGVFSTAPDLIKVCNMILQDGCDNSGNKVLEKGILGLIAQNRIPDLSHQAAYGWEYNQPHFMGTKVGPKSFGKTGFTGCSVVVDPDLGRSLVILSNYTWPKRKPDRSRIDEFRREVADLVFATPYN